MSTSVKSAFDGRQHQRYHFFSPKIHDLRAVWAEKPAILLRQPKITHMSWCSRETTTLNATLSRYWRQCPAHFVYVVRLTSAKKYGSGEVPSTLFQQSRATFRAHRFDVPFRLNCVHMYTPCTMKQGKQITVISLKGGNFYVQIQQKYTMILLSRWLFSSACHLAFHCQRFQPMPVPRIIYLQIKTDFGTWIIFNVSLYIDISVLLCTT